ncbi:MAG: hypothetical protein OEZ41_12725 [Nitrospirota bacterium]|nr:hypothetical protein [Nitrospirota bacterium]
MLLLLGATVFTFPILELATRIFIDPIDYLMPTLLEDKVFGITIKPKSAGHDALGFRNKEVPKKVDVVTIGDSMTYGYSASFYNSWPLQFEKMTNFKVYNAAIGGWGPHQYFCAIKKYALPLNPKSIIIGLYLGNDLLDAYKYKSIDCELNLKYAGSDEIPIVSPHNRIFGNLRDWLSRNSVFYQLLKYNLGDLGNYLSMVLAKIHATNTTHESIIVDNQRIKGVFEPRMINNLDISTLEVKTGLNLTVGLLSKMQSVCKENNISCFFLLIPTKESVYSKALKKIDQNNTDTYKPIYETAKLETKIRTTLKENLKSHIEFIDPLANMQERIALSSLYPLSNDIHPNVNGYYWIAWEVSRLVGKKFQHITDLPPSN